MKKWICIALTVVMILSFAACKKTIEVDEDTFADGD